MKANSQTLFEAPIFMGLAPPNLHCFLAQVRKRYYSAMYHFIQCLRHGDSSEFHEGVIYGMTRVLYDANTTDAYVKLQRFEKLKALAQRIREAAKE